MDQINKHISNKQVIYYWAYLTYHSIIRVWSRVVDRILTRRQYVFLGESLKTTFAYKITFKSHIFKTIQSIIILNESNQHSKFDPVKQELSLTSTSLNVPVRYHQYI